MGMAEVFSQELGQVFLRGTPAPEAPAAQFLLASISYVGKLLLAPVLGGEAEGVAQLRGNSDFCLVAHTLLDQRSTFPSCYTLLSDLHRHGLCPSVVTGVAATF